MKHVFLLDATRHMGLVQSLIGSAQAYTSQFQPEVVEWYSKPQQAADFKQAGLQVHVMSASSAWSAIESRLKELAQDSSDELLFHVLSYDPIVVQSAAALNSQNLAVSALSLATISRKDGITKRTAAVLTPRPEPPLTLSEGIQATKKLLDRLGATSPGKAIKQSMLRKLLAQEDPRFAYNGTDLVSRTLISDVVSDGMRKDWLQRFRLENQTGTERLYLTTSNVGGGDQPVSALPRVASVGDAISTTPLLPTPSAKTEPDDKGRRRTEQMISCLKKRRIYSPKTIRDYIFKSLKETTTQSTLIPLSASQLNRQVCTTAQVQAKADGIAFDYWYAASDAVLEMMFAAGVLLDENKQPIRPSLQARGTRVHGIVPDFEDRCEAFLLEYLIKSLQDITQRDRTALAHALFKVDPKQKSIFDMQDRVDELLVQLQGAVHENDDGILVFKTRTLAAVS